MNNKTLTLTLNIYQIKNIYNLKSILNKFNSIYFQKINSYLYINHNKLYLELQKYHPQQNPLLLGSITLYEMGLTYQITIELGLITLTIKSN